MAINERQAVRLVARFVPWLAPIPSVWLVGRAVMVHLGFPLLVAIVTAVVVEALGLVSVFNWQAAGDWNRRKLKADTPAQPWLPAVLGVVYLVLTIGLVVVLDVSPWLATYAPAALPLLAMIGTVNLAIFAGQEHREAKAAAARAERKRQRQGRKAEAAKRQPVAIARKRKTETGNGNRQAAIDLLAAMPDISGAELGRQLGLSERQGRNLRVELLPEIDGNGKDPAQA